MFEFLVINRKCKQNKLKKFRFSNVFFRKLGWKSKNNESRLWFEKNKTPQEKASRKNNLPLSRGEVWPTRDGPLRAYEYLKCSFVPSSMKKAARYKRSNNNLCCCFFSLYFVKEKLCKTRRRAPHTQQWNENFFYFFFGLLFSAKKAPESRDKDIIGSNF